MSEPCLCGADDCDSCNPGGAERIGVDQMVESHPEFCPESIAVFAGALQQIADSHDSRQPDPVALAFEEARKGNYRLAWTLLLDVVMAQCRANAEDALHDAISIRDQARIDDESEWRAGGWHG